KDREEGRKFLKEITDAFDFRLLGEESIEGRPSWIIEGTPRSGFKPTLNHADVPTKLRGKLWIDVVDRQRRVSVGQGRSSGDRDALVWLGIGSHPQREQPGLRSHACERRGLAAETDLCRRIGAFGLSQEP